MTVAHGGNIFEVSQERGWDWRDVADFSASFFFKQKTAYELAQCDWSSDVCSSDLVAPDGRSIAFTSDRTGQYRLWLMTRDGSEARQLTAVSDDKEMVEKSPYFSGDGRYIYYVSEQAGQGWIRKISIDGGESLPVSRVEKYVDKPVPSPDG